MRNASVSMAAMLLLAACATSQPTASPAPQQPAAAKASAPVAAAPGTAEVTPTGVTGQARALRTETARATVKTVDLATRMLTVQDADGTTETFRVGPEVQRLGEIAPGDVVEVTFEQGLLLEYQPAGSETVEPVVAAAGVRAGQNEPPGGAAATGVQGTVTVTAIDAANRVVVFQGPQGNVYQVKAGPGVQLEKLKVGDRLLATYTETLAVTVQKAPKM